MSGSIHIPRYFDDDTKQILTAITGRICADQQSRDCNNAKLIDFHRKLQEAKRD